LKDFDPTRFIHSEGAQGSPKDPEAVDVIARFYPRTQDAYVNPNIPEGEDAERAENARWERLLSIARDTANGDRPVMTSEYAHAMGNAMGNFKEYWDEIYSHPRMLGGFIWDWADQGIYQKLPDGRIQVSYGGDFGDKPNLKAFCFNGVVLSDRSTTPKYEEVKKVYQPFLIELLPQAANEKDLRIRLTNRQHHLSTEPYELSWVLCQEGKEVEEIVIPETFNGKPVTAIGSWAFAGNMELKKITIPKTIKTIFGNAFGGCGNLEQVIIPKETTRIDGTVFTACDKITIFCEAESKPSGWNKNWNTWNCPVYWYREENPNVYGFFWHYEDGKPSIWKRTV
jgi:hypothetical protein